MVGSLNPESPKVSVKQEPSVTSVPKLTIKTEPLERTVVSQTVSTTVVHVRKSFYIEYSKLSPGGRPFKTDISIRLAEFTLWFLLTAAQKTQLCKVKQGCHQGAGYMKKASHTFCL